jgi:hypothetical protein
MLAGVSPGTLVDSVSEGDERAQNSILRGSSVAGSRGCLGSAPRGILDWD